MASETIEEATKGEAIIVIKKTSVIVTVKENRNVMTWPHIHISKRKT